MRIELALGIAGVALVFALTGCTANPTAQQPLAQPPAATPTASVEVTSAPKVNFAEMDPTPPNISEALSGLGMEQLGIDLPGDATIKITWMDQMFDKDQAKVRGAEMANKVAAVLLANTKVKSVKFEVSNGGTTLYEETKRR